MNKEIKLSFKLAVIIGAFLYALGEMIAGHIHWAIGDLILIALWMGGKSTLKEMKRNILKMERNCK